MKKLRKKSLAGLAQGLTRYEDSRNSLKTSDYTDLQTFLSGYLNTPDKKQRRRLAEEFRKRHMELYTFIKENQELIAAETELSRIIHAAVNGETIETEREQLTNLLQMMEESMHDVQ
jgi:hypothetical protein